MASPLKRNGTAQAIREALIEADRPLTVAELMEELEHQGYDFHEKNVRSTLHQRGVAGEVVKGKRDTLTVYSIDPDFQLRGSTPAALAPAGSAPGASLGLSCGRTAQPAPATDTRAQLDAVLDDGVAYSLATLQTLLGGRVPRGQLLHELGEMAREGALHSRFDADENGNVYWRVDADGGDSAASLEDAVAQATQAAAERLPPPAPVPAKADGVGGPRDLSPMALDERLDAAAGDLHDAVCDACDAELPHALIKQLLLASNATARALQLLRG